MTTHRLRAVAAWLFATLLAVPAATPAQAPQPSASITAPEVRRLVDAFVARNDFTGVVLVARGDRVLDLRAWGYADLEDSVRTAVDTRYELGSVSKWVASLVVLALVDQGKLALDAPITTYLPEYRQDTGARLTLHHLLTHTSGIPNDVVTALRADTTLMHSPLSSAEAVRRFASGELQFAPGSRFDYSHANWLVVQAVIERVTGRPYADVVRATLWGPLGLRSSGIFTGDFSQQAGMRGADAARGYATLTPAPRRRQVFVPDFMGAAARSYSTAPDLLALLNGVYGTGDGKSRGRLLSAASLAALDRVYVPEEGYAYGSRLHTLTLGGRPTTVAWHTGTNGAYKTLAARVLTDGWTVIVLSNTSADLNAMGALADAVFGAVHP